MLKSSLIEILRTFSKQELIKFEDFVKSPYFNKKENVIKIFLEIKKYAPDFTDENLKKEKMWIKLFPGREYNYGIMKNIIFDYCKLAERFLNLQNYETKNFEQDINLLEELKERKLSQQYEKNLNSFKEEVNNAAFDQNYFYYKYIADYKEQALLFINKNNKDKNFCKPENMNENLIAFFLVNFFVKNYNFIHESEFYNKPVDQAIVESVFKFFESSSLNKNEFVLIFYYTLKIVKDLNDENSFLKLKELLNNNFVKFSHGDKFNFYMALVNFCNFKIMKGTNHYIKELFEIYKVMIENGFYNTGSDKNINPSMYANIVSIAGNLKQFDWAEKFLVDFKDKLPSSDKELHFALANATLNIKKGNYNFALNFLSTCKSTDPITKITIKRFQIMIYYESGFFEELYSLIDASKHFISNDKKVTDSAKNIFNNFLHFVLRLAELKSGVHKKKDNEFNLQILKNEILRNDVTNKIWLIEKLDELEFKS